MGQLLGEYDCKIDAKGRVMLPTALRKQIEPEAKEKFVLNRGFENCIAMYPYNEWQKIYEKVNELNLYVKKNRDFVRYFFRGAIEIEPDATGRLLLPKRLVDYAGIQKELILSAHNHLIEIWDKQTFDNLLQQEPGEFAELAEEVMGGLNSGGDNGEIS